MKIQISKDILLPVLQSSNTFVERKQSQSILGSLLFVAEAEYLQITATDLEVELISKVTSSALELGRIVLPARKLLDICRALPNGASIVIEDMKTQVKLTSGRSKFSLQKMAPEEYPTTSLITPILKFKMKKNVLIELFEETTFSMASQDVRHFLNGLLIEFSAKQIRAVATDGHRLALSEKEAAIEIIEDLSVIVPRKGILELLRLLQNTEEEDLEVQINKSNLSVNIGNQRMKTKLLEGNFPDYKRVIPPDADNFILANREELKGVLTRTSILSNEKFRGIRLNLAKNVIVAVAHNPEKEEAEEELSIEYEGADLDVGFNVAYLLDVLGIIRSDTVRLDIIDGDHSCLLRDPENLTTQYVVMPMRL
jgi:DNA polymerase III subunit beta